MRRIWIKILLVILMLLPIPFSCKDKSESLDLYVEPYFRAQDMFFHYVDIYYINPKTKAPTFETINQDYDNTVYPADSMALYFHVPDTQLLYHSQRNIKKGFSFIQESFASTVKRPGYLGTRDLVDKIYISSNYEYDETHGKDYDLSDIVEIIYYSHSGPRYTRMLLSDFNKSSPYEAPKRFYLLIRRKPTKSKTQQFVVKYYMKNEPGTPSKYFIMETPVFHVR